MQLLEGQTAVVWGATGRVGLPIARTLFANGANVVLHYKNSKDKATAAARKLDQTGDRVMLVQADICREDLVKEAMDMAKKRFHAVDIVVNAVHGPFTPKPVADMTLDDWSVHLDALRGHFLICRSAIPIMRAQGHGRIVYISGGLSRRHAEGCSAYTTVKAGLDAFSKTLAMEEGRNNITINIVAPGKVEVEDVDAVNENDESKYWEQMNKRSLSSTPLGRHASADDVALAVLYFVSPWASGITGQTLFAACGEIMP